MLESQFDRQAYVLVAFEAVLPAFVLPAGEQVALQAFVQPVAVAVEVVVLAVLAVLPAFAGRKRQKRAPTAIVKNRYFFMLHLLRGNYKM